MRRLIPAVPPVIGIACALGLLCAATATAQSNLDGPTPPALALGNPTPSYALSGVDHINYFNGSLQVDLPIMPTGGRGDLPRSLTFPIYNRWYVDQATMAGVADSAYGGYAYSLGGYFGFQSAFAAYNTSPCQNPSSPNYNDYLPQAGAPTLAWGQWQKVDGTTIMLADEQTNGEPEPGPSDGCTPYDRGKVYHSFDGSALTFVLYSDPYNPASGTLGTLYLPDGTQYTWVYSDTVPSTTTITMRDRNGNETLQQWNPAAGYTGSCPIGTFDYTDSAGRSQSITYTADPSCLSYDTIQFPASTQSGGQRTIKVNYDLMQNHLAAGQQIQTTKNLFPLLYGSLQTPYNPYVVSSIVLPDQTSYSFVYDSYGEVTQMTLPTGGVIQYSWVGMSSDGTGELFWNNGLSAAIYRRVSEREEYANGPANGLTGKTVFTPTSLSGGPDTNHPQRSGGVGLQVDVNFEDGTGNQLRHETHWFYGDPSQAESVPEAPTDYPAWSDGLEYQTQVSQSGTAKQQQSKLWQQQPCSGCWFNAAPATPDTALRMNSPLVCQSNSTLDPNTQSAATSGLVIFYDFFDSVTSNITGQYEYDFGSAPSIGATCPSSAPSGPFRSTSYSYEYTTNAAYGPPTASNSSTANLLNIVASKNVTGSDGSQSIDNFYYDQSTPQPVTGAPGHDDTDYGSSYNTRGNLTSHQVYQSETGTYPGESFTWDTLGREVSWTDFNSHTTSYGYNPSNDPSQTFPTTVTNALSQTTTYTYDQNILQMLSAKDPNGSTTQYNYQNDPLDRLTSVVRAGGSETVYSYPLPTQITVRQDQNTPGDGALRTDTIFDDLGRQIQSIAFEANTTANCGSGVACITTATTYDALGRVTSVSNPYRPGDTEYYTTYAYDALNRATNTTTTFDSAQSNTQFAGNQATITDPAGHVKVQVVDAAGRLKSVTEDPSGLDYLSQYQYDAFDDLKLVTQGAQTRTFVFDSRARLRSTTNPENGTTAYGYDNNNNLTSRTDNQNVVTTYGYDSVNRLTSVTYSGARTAPSVAYSYDSGTTNAIGRLVSVANSAGTEQQITGYDALGRVIGSTETVGGTPYTSFSYTYNLADALVSTTYPSGRVVTNGYDGANRISSVTGTGAASRTYVSSATYAAFGSIGGFNYAVTNGAAAGARSFSYNGRLQLGEMHDQASSLFDLKYYYGNAATTGTAGASTSSNNGNPTGVVESAQKGSGTLHSFTQSYGYDHANRVSTASDTGGWAQNFSFDQFGNPWTTVNTGLPADRLPTSNVYNGANNRSSYAGTVYDSAGMGNQITMGSMQLTFDAENRILQAYNTVSQNSTCYGYDGMGERVYKQTFGGNTCAGTAAATINYLYDSFGNLDVEYDSGTVTTPACLTCYLTWDHLGSVRMVSDTVAGGFTGFHDYAPFGEEVLANAGRTSDWGTVSNGTDYLNQRYTGAARDAESTLDFLQARYLANQQGRFVTPDPAGNFVADPGNPQSWNMYSYAFSNPLAYFDPSGLDAFDPSDPCDDDPTCGGGIGIGIGIGIGWPGGSGGGYQPPPAEPPGPPSVVRMPSPDRPPYGTMGGSASGTQAQCGAQGSQYLGGGQNGCPVHPQLPILGPTVNRPAGPQITGAPPKTPPQEASLPALIVSFPRNGQYTTFVACEYENTGADAITNPEAWVVSGGIAAITAVKGAWQFGGWLAPWMRYLAAGAVAESRMILIRRACQGAVYGQ